MNENLQPQTLAVNTWLDEAVTALKEAGITTAQLDAEIILAHTLKESRTHLHAHSEEIIDARTREVADARLALRLERVPVAYIIGHKEFYGRRFSVTTATLIPRPESEGIIDIVKDLQAQQSLFREEKLRIVDVGTGSGCLGITLKLEIPESEVTLLDISAPALKIAEKNAEALHADVRVIKSDLLASYPFEPNIIIANLPYVDESWERSPETQFEPQIALFAPDGGKAFIKKLIVQASSRLQPLAYIVLEADPEQHQAIISYAAPYGLKLVTQQDYCIVLQRGT